MHEYDEGIFGAPQFPLHESNVKTVPFTITSLIKKPLHLIYI